MQRQLVNLVDNPQECELLSISMISKSKDFGWWVCSVSESTCDVSGSGLV